MRYFFMFSHTFWRHEILLDVMTYFYHCNILFRSFCYHDVLSLLFDTMTYFFSYDIRFEFWHTISKHFGIITYFLTLSCTSWHHSALLDVMTHCFAIMPYFLYCLMSWHTFWLHDILLDSITFHDILFVVMTYFFTSWRFCIHNCISPVRMYLGGYHGLVVVTSLRPHPHPRPQTFHRLRDKIKNPYRIASIFYM